MSDRIEWYSRDDDGHVEHHVFIPMAAHNNYYGYDPPEPGPFVWCAKCNNAEVYTDDNIINGQIVCEDCMKEFLYDDLVIEYLKDCRDEQFEWAKEICQQIRDEHEDDLAEYFLPYK